VSAPVRAPALVEILEAAGAIVRRALASPIDVAEKADGSPVTGIDREVDSFLRQELGLLLPGSGWLSEETADDRRRLGRDLTWIVDPIDGTKELVARLPEIAISIGLVRGGRVVAAAVQNPLTEERGVWVLDSSPSFAGLGSRPDPASLDEAEAIVSRTETARGDLAGLDDVVGGARPVGSVAYKLLRVAAGADHLTYSVLPKSEWDVCGGSGLIEAAGRAYVRLDGSPNLWNRPDPVIRCGAVAGPAPLAEALRRILVARLGGPVRCR
jgi:myo-inositol-1(or 4)-monophosphatase